MGIAALLIIAGGIVHASNSPDDNDRLAVKSKTVATPLYFEQNQGQTDPSVRYVHRSDGLTAFLRDTDVVMQVPVAT